ncbi:rhodanese-like domain-containing protein [Mycoplasmatota bacterium WC44]
MENVSISELNSKLAKVNVIDVRETYEYDMGRVPGSKNVPLRELAFNHVNYLKEGEEYYIICQSGSRSMQLVDYLREHNYKLVNVLGGTGMYGLQYSLER